MTAPKTAIASWVTKRVLLVQVPNDDPMAAVDYARKCKLIRDNDGIVAVNNKPGWTFFYVEKNVSKPIITKVGEK